MTPMTGHRRHESASTLGPSMLVVSVWVVVHIAHAPSILGHTSQLYLLQLSSLLVAVLSLFPGDDLDEVHPLLARVRIGLGGVAIALISSL